MESTVFIEIMLNLIDKKDMNDFMLMTFNSGYRLDEARMEKLVDAALTMDERLNELFGTAQTATKEYLLSIFAKPVAKEKKARDKAKSKKQIAHELEVEEMRLAKERKKKFLAGIRARAEAARKEKDEKDI